ncbi:hypothetical protein AUCHE_05_04460 [Austwickia chelonae NBRC 105200]|uniref:Uncharacterized protein n=2 Tax=Austwickia TaxID=1184606 RepID=K6VLF3_9MICO|nr:hypothetical protein AUCHE_05_04460 [Austwickia chelonae NBRC 105200]
MHSPKTYLLSGEWRETSDPDRSPGASAPEFYLGTGGPPHPSDRITRMRIDRMGRTRFSLVGIFAFSMSSCASSDSQILTQQIVSEATKNPSSVAIPAAHGEKSGSIICPYSNLDELDDPIRIKAEGSDIDTSNESKQWVTHRSGPTPPVSINRSEVDFCSSGKNIDFTSGTLFYAERGSIQEGKKWVLKLKATPSPA